MLPGGSGYFTCIQNMKLCTNKFKSGELHEKHVVATWNLENHLSICLQTQGNREKPVSRWPVAGQNYPIDEHKMLLLTLIVLMWRIG